jgi:hypothetical protein
LQIFFRRDSMKSTVCGRKNPVIAHPRSVWGV